MKNGQSGGFQEIPCQLPGPDLDLSIWPREKIIFNFKSSLKYHKLMTTHSFERSQIINHQSFYWTWTLGILKIPQTSFVAADQPEDLEKDQKSQGGPSVHSTKKYTKFPYCPSPCRCGDRMSMSQGGVLPTSLRSTSNMIFKPISSNSIRSKQHPHALITGPSYSIPNERRDKGSGCNRVYFKNSFSFRKQILFCSG